MCTPLAGGIRGKPSPARGLARHSRGRSCPLLTRRSQTLCSGPVVTARKMKYSVMGAGRKAKICMKVYAFDVDETLYLSHGPVQWEALVALRAEGHVLGLCGNWAAVTLQVPEWHRVLSFIGPGVMLGLFIFIGAGSAMDRKR